MLEPWAKISQRLRRYSNSITTAALTHVAMQPETRQRTSDRCARECLVNSFHRLVHTVGSRCQPVRKPLTGVLNAAYKGGRCAKLKLRL